MKNDGLKFTDETTQEEVVFNLYTFCEILKGCINKYCNTSMEEATKSVEDCKTFKSPISSTNDVYFFSHEHPYHWAMICYYGDMYWKNKPELVQIPESYDNWETNYIKENNLKEEVFIF
ncbi:hypothetical protein [Tenacibaculum sp. SDUM215027]|uniref:hypothetical protein n=1 Tax=Tenacibaculum sp. SDUM215027 TaxID=3422596 RepID=UPI003D3132ED